jgi:tyrosyl-tRNA synthetase
MKEEGLEPQVVLTVPLLVGLDGREKMSKSLGNHIALEDPPQEVFGKTMSIPDGPMWDWLLLLTDLPEEEIAARRARVEAGALHPKEVKVDLARRLVTWLHGAAAAEAAHAEFERVFAAGGVPDEVPEVTVPAGLPLTKLLVAAGLAASNADARRLVDQGAVHVDGERLGDPFAELPAGEPRLVKVGKRRFARVHVG